MNAGNLERQAKMLELHRITLLADVVRQERIVHSVVGEMRRRLASPLPTADAALLDGWLRDLAKVAELGESERESLDEIEKVIRAIRSEAQ
jgi:hypothetical protein